MNKHRIYMVLGALLILSLVLVSVAAAAPTGLKKLQSPRLLSPKNGANLTLDTPCQQLVLNWSKVRNVDHYAVNIEYLNGNDWIPIYAEWTYTNSNVTWPVAFSNEYQYRWYVAAEAPLYDTSWSRTNNTFTVTLNANVC